MAEFLFRWFLGSVATGLALLALRGGGSDSGLSLGSFAVARGGGSIGFLASMNWGMILLASIWVGFLNAFVRPIVLRFCVGGPRIWLWVTLVTLNLLLFGTLRAWVPGLGGWGGGWMELGLGVVWVSSVSWFVGSVFRDQEGRWHPISYHGRMSTERRPQRRNREAGEDGG